ncbi:hypothetical protein ASE82_08570 [Sphingomonas sp. Leaf230]|nr:hypothetical protein ASE82_08570 [Sphingomonas sp. Leaf230]
MLKDEGLDLAGALEHMRPPCNWPDKAIQTPDAFRAGAFDLRKMTDTRKIEKSFERLGEARACLMIRRPAVGQVGLCVHVVGDGLETAMMSRDFSLTTAAGKARLQLRRLLPFTLGSLMLGRRVGDLIGHPLLVGRDYVVERLTQCPSRGLSNIHFETGRVDV